jgi:hypothetical protein
MIKLPPEVKKLDEICDVSIHLSAKDLEHDLYSKDALCRFIANTMEMVLNDLNQKELYLFLYTKPKRKREKPNVFQRIRNN